MTRIPEKPATPVLRADAELEQAGAERPTVALPDAQYWNEQQMDDVTAGHGIQVLIPPDSGKRRRATGLDRRPLLVHATRARD